jgi:hypothetical protein
MKRERSREKETYSLWLKASGGRAEEATLVNTLLQAALVRVRESNR